MEELEGKGRQEIIDSEQLLNAGRMGHQTAVETGCIEKGKQILVCNRNPCAGCD